jgi:AraC-like DNA-binding protein
MSLIYTERASDSPYVETVINGFTVSDGSTIRPSEIHWHMVFTKVNGVVLPIMTGPLTSSGVASWGGDAEILWLKFKLGTFMPHLPPKQLLNTECVLPEASSQKFWLNGSAWQFPDFENVDIFVNRLVREGTLQFDPVVHAALQDEAQDTPSRTVRHRFLRSTGVTQSHIRQYERAQHAKSLLQQGVSILDTVFEAGYFDQSHLTRSLKQFIGHTPGQRIALASPTE